MKWSMNDNIPLYTNKGKDALLYQDQLAHNYKYKKLENSNPIHLKYIDELPLGFTAKEHTITPNIKNGYEIKPEFPIPIYSRKGTLIANKMNRIVIGDYGAFIEIAPSDMVLPNIKIKEGQEYRINDEKYSQKVKYHWYTTKDESNCKLYYQQKFVTYADYKPGFWYISPHEVLSKEELLCLGFIKQDLIKNKKTTPLKKLEKEKTEYLSKNKNFDFSYLNNKKILVFDTETTGLSNYDEIIQISIYELNLKDNKSNNITEIYSTLIKPEHKKSWPEASKTNHIYPKTVKNAPMMKDIKQKLKNIFESADIIVGHNIGFDIRMLKNCSGIDLSKKEVIDTLDLFRRDKTEKPHNLETAVRFYIPHKIKWFLNGAHQADTDTRATAEILKEMWNRARELSILDKINKEEDERDL